MYFPEGLSIAITIKKIKKTMGLSSKELSNCLQSIYTQASIIDKLKIIYRPYICPFSDLINACKDSKSIMDIGCGSGQFLLLLSQYTKATNLGGIEISETLVNNAIELLSSQDKIRSHVEVFDGTHIPDFICEFDTITMIDVFHHIPKISQESFVTQLFRKMKTGSKFILKDINASHPLLFMNKFHDTLLGGGPGKEISVSTARELLTKTGFQIISVLEKTMLWYPHYTIICVK